MHAVLVVQPHPSCTPTLLTLHEVVQENELGDGWLFGALDVDQGPHFDPTVAIPLSAVRCMAFVSDPEKLGAVGSRLLELNRQMTGSRPGSRLFEMSVPVAGSAFEYAANAQSQAQSQLQEIAEMVERTRVALGARNREALPEAANRVMRTWALEVANFTAEKQAAEHAAQAERTAAERERSKLLRLVSDMCLAMQTWANDAGGMPVHAADSYHRATRLLSFPAPKEDC